MECHEAAHCGGDVGDEFVFGLDARFEVEMLEVEGGFAAFELGVEASDELIVAQDGEAEVAPYTLRRGLVCLEYQLKSPELGVSSLCPEEAVEWREEGCVIGNDVAIGCALKKGEVGAVD